MSASERFNLVTSLLDERLGAIGDRVAVSAGTGQYAWGEIARLVNRAGNAIMGLDVGLEDRILIALPDGVELVTAWLAVVKIGAVAVCADPALSPAALKGLLEFSRAKLFVMSARERERIEEAIPTSPHLRRVISVGRPEGKEVSWEEALGGQMDDLEPLPTCGDDVACWLFAEGEPLRAAAHTHRGLASATKACAEFLGPDAEGGVPSPSGLHRGLSLQTALLLPLASGRPASTRAPQGWGSIETGFCLCSRPREAPSGSSGRLLSGYVARIVRADGADAAAGETGALWVRGEGVAQGYVRDREATTRVFRGEWVVTGEPFAVDAEGWYWRRGPESSR